VDRILPPAGTPPGLRGGFTKLRLWEMEDFDQVRGDDRGDAKE
jgi:hypothetical protein